MPLPRQRKVERDEKDGLWVGETGRERKGRTEMAVCVGRGEGGEEGKNGDERVCVCVCVCGGGGSWAGT